MKRFSIPLIIRHWRRKRQRWPLNRQIAIIFAFVMVTNVILISSAFDYWGDYVIQRELKQMGTSINPVI
jgi:hypothetical protein